MTRQSRSLAVPDTLLAADEWPGQDPPVVLLHAGVADRRSWYQTAELLDGPYVLAYDRRGFGETGPSAAPFRHVDDLLEVLRQLIEPGQLLEPAWLVGSSMGGQAAIDAALLAPEAVAGLVLIAPAVSGEPDEALDPDSERLDALVDAADEAGDLAEVGRLEAWLWLDGPGQPEGRVGGPARALALEMNAVALAQAGEHKGASGLDAWSRLEELTVPTTVAWGDLDLPVITAQCEVLVERVPDARRQVLHGMAHMPYLEDPAAVAALIRAATAG